MSEEIPKVTVSSGLSELAELKFVDKDIEDEFRNTQYYIGTPIACQLSRDIKELIKAIRSLKCELDGDDNA